MVIGPARYTKYIVCKGDSLYRISLLKLGSPSRWKEIVWANRLKPPYRLLIGMTLRIPDRHRLHHHPRPHGSNHRHASPYQYRPPHRPPSAHSQLLGPHATPEPHAPPPNPEPAPTDFALEVLWPTCQVVFARQGEQRFPGGRIRIKLEGKVSLKRKGSFQCEAGVTDKTLTDKVKAEYKNLLGSLTSDATFRWDPSSQRWDLSYKCGINLKSASFDLKYNPTANPPTSIVVSFAEQKVSIAEMVGSVKAVVELSKDDQFDKSKPFQVAVQLRQPIEDGQFDWTLAGKGAAVVVTGGAAAAALQAGAVGGAAGGAAAAGAAGGAAGGAAAAGGGISIIEALEILGLLAL